MGRRDEHGWLDDGEELLWTGKASVRLAVARLGAILLVEIGFLYAVYRALADTLTLEQLTGEVQRALESEPLTVAVPAVLLLAVLALVPGRWIRDRHAITDRRLVAFRRGGAVSWSLPPDLVLEVRRGRLFGIFDLRFNHTLAGSSKSRRTAFHCVPDIAAVAERVRHWHDARQEDVRRSVEDRTPLTSREGRFSIEVPSSWQVREVRLDDPAEARLLRPMDDEPSPAGEVVERDGWNAVVLTGPWRTSLSIEGYPPDARERERAIDEPPSWLLSLLGAGVTEHEEEARLGGLVGERVRMTARGARLAGPRRHRAVYHFDQWTLQGVDRWYRVIAVWSEALPVAGEALREVVETFRPLDSAGPASRATSSSTGARPR